MRAHFILLGVALCAVAASARADVIPPPGDCEQKVEGQACTDFGGKPGASPTKQGKYCSVSNVGAKSNGDAESFALLSIAFASALALRRKRVSRANFP